jgi:DNA-binding CsgD family transcriptional regulator/PAS domain-containing protein
MGTSSQHTNRTLEPFLFSLHSSASVRDVQATCAGFANELIPADAYGWYQFKRDTTEPDVISARGVSDRFLSLYESQGRSRDPIFSKVAARLATVSSDHHLNAGEQQSFKFQGEISSGRIGRAIQAPLVVAGELLGSINIARGPDAPVFRRDDAACLDLIARHASIALARARREQDFDRRCTLFEASLDVLGLPFVLTAADGNIIFANRAAAATGLAGGLSGGLADGLRETADMLASGQCRVATVVLQPGRDPGCDRLAIRSIKLDQSRAMMSFIYAAPDETASALPILTRREREIADFVMRGFSNSDIALAASISRNTVKLHLKRVFEKLQVSSRAELAAALARAESSDAAHGLLKPLPAMPFPDDQAVDQASGGADPSRSRKRP